MFARYIAPAILVLCALALFALARHFSRCGRPGKAVLDIIGGCSLLIVAYHIATL